MMAEVIEWLGNALAAIVSRGKVVGAQRGQRNLLQVQLLSGEAADGVEFVAPYGMSALPGQGDAIMLTVGGTRDHKVIIAVDDPARRIRDLAPGEFGFSDGNSSVVFRSGALEIKTTLPLTIQADGAVNLTGSAVNLGLLNATMRKLVDERFVALFNAHTHGGVQTGGGTTGAPTTPMATGSHTTTTTKAS